MKNKIKIFEQTVFPDLTLGIGENGKILILKPGDSTLKRIVEEVIPYLSKMESDLRQIDFDKQKASKN